MFAGTGNSQYVTSKTLAGDDLLNKTWMAFRVPSVFSCSNVSSGFKFKIVARNNCSNRLVDSRDLGLFVEEEETAVLVVHLGSSGDFLLQKNEQDAARQRRHVEIDSSRVHPPLNPVTFDLNKPCRTIQFKVSDFVVYQYCHK